MKTETKYWGTIAIIFVLVISINVVYTELRLTTFQAYDPRTERSYDISVWLRIDYGEDKTPNDIEIPLTKPPLPVYNNEFEIVRWVYHYAHLSLNISRNPIYQDVLLMIYAPRVVFELFSSVSCLWEAEDDTGTIIKTDFIAAGAYFIALDGRIEKTIFQEFYTDPIYADITLVI